VSATRAAIARIGRAGRALLADIGLARVTSLVVGFLLVLGVMSTSSVTTIGPPGPSSAASDEKDAEAEVPTSTDPIERWSRLRLAEMSTDDKVRSLLIGHVSGVNPEGMRFAVTPVASGGAGWGGIILMRDNVAPDPAEVAALTASVIAEPELPPIVAIDQEGGDVVRLTFDPYPGADELRNQPVGATADAFAGRGQLLASVGVNVNFGIVADVTSDRRSYIHSRTLGDSAAESAERVVAAVTSEQAHVASTLKHFPGHGRSVGDSHFEIPVATVDSAEWRASDSVPFSAGIRAGARFVMFGHLLFPAIDGVPASLSVAWHDVLRRDLGFRGITVTDDLLMLQASGDARWSDPYSNAVAALAAGNDALLYVFPADPSTVGIDLGVLVSTLTQAVESGIVSPAQLDASALRMLTFRRELAPGAERWRAPCDFGCSFPREPRGTVPEGIAIAEIALTP
jgi:beta-N-acetylhexosaminidase